MFLALLKHELISNSKYMIIEFVCIIIMGFLCGILNLNIIDISSILYTVLIIIVALLMMFINILLFSQIINIFKINAFENRHILFQIPVSSYELVGSKIMFAILSIFFTLLSFGIALVIVMLFSFGDVKFINEIVSFLTNPFFLVLGLFAFLFLLSLFNVFMLISAILNSGSIRGNKDVWYVVFSYIYVFIFTCIIMFDPIGLTIMMTSSNEIIITSISNDNYVPIINLYPFIVLILSSIITFFVTVYILDNKLELE